MNTKNPKKTIVFPGNTFGLLTPEENYWAMYYYAIIKTLRYQITISSPWGDELSLSEYKGKPREGGIFQRMKNTLMNHSVEYLMEDFFLSRDGKQIFMELCEKILEEYKIHDFDIKEMLVVKVGNDTSQIDYRKIALDEKTELLIPKSFGERALLPTSSNLTNALRNTDLLVIISDGNKKYAFVGEVEGLHGESLYRDSYYKKRGGIKSLFSSFYIGVSNKNKGAENINIKGEVALERLTNGPWILHFSTNHFFIKDYKAALNCMAGLIDGHFGVIDNVEDKAHQAIIAYVIAGWRVEVSELLFKMREFYDLHIHGHDTYQPGTDPESVIYRPSSDATILPKPLTFDLVNIRKPMDNW